MRAEERSERGGGPSQVEFITQYLPCRDIPHRMLMMTTVVVFTTVVINGTSMAWLSL